MPLIIFDLDGTLIDSVPDLSSALDAALTQLKLPPAGEAAARRWVGNGASKLIERALNAAHADIEQYRDRALDSFFKHYADHCADQTVLYPGVKDTLAALEQQQVAMAIATNKPREFIQPIIQKLGIDQYFSMCVGGDDFLNKKPHPESLLHIVNTLNAEASTSLMVGDSRNDIQAAQRAGMPVVAVSYGYNHGEPVTDYQPDRVIDHFADLLTCFDELITDKTTLSQPSPS